MSFRPRPVYLSDSFMLPVGKYNGRHRQKLSFFELVDSLQLLLDKGAIHKDKIDCVIVGSQNPFAFSGVDNLAAKVSGRLGISGAKSLLVDTASSSGASAFEAAYLEVASGQHNQVLAIGIQKMSDVSTTDATKIVAGVIDREEAEYGLTMPACGALVAQALMQEFQLNKEEWTNYSARLTERAHRFSALNPDAHLNYPLPVHEYFSGISSGKNYLYYDPLHYYDFCPMSDGIAACLLSTQKSDIRVSGVGSGTDIPTIADRLTLTSFPATIIALSQVLGMAGLKNLAELEGSVHINMHDPFNGFGPINLADLGVVSRDNLLDALLDDDITGPNGRFPTNLTGGLKGRGHPLGATGMIQIVENHQLLKNGDFKAAISHSIGGPINNNVVILLETEEHLQHRKISPYRSIPKPPLGTLKPANINLETILGKENKCSVKLVAKTSKHDYRSGAEEKSLLLFSKKFNGKKYRFLIGVDPEIAEPLQNLKAGDKIQMERLNGELRVNDVPIRRFYRKTIEGMVDMADTAFRHLRRKK
ncbi:thiolase family protein [uncultured Desulfuromusa sp.]|uniref:thiolase family protein n=1 Tax=uncultured Desulfuromusa sp. TaxID=219183 RepID=UPI002AA87741|nr:thiolase family protein [uncultured Desulfuromusa sp.]